MENNTIMKYTPTSLCHIDGLSCFGCCGHDFTSRKEVAQGILLNTLTYIKHTKEKLPVKNFRERSQHLRFSGICYNLVYLDFEKNRKNKIIGCPLHPTRNKGKDLRENYCEIDHLCKSAFIFNNYSSKKKKEFINFLKNKKLDWYTYSLMMDNNELIEEFESMK